MRSRNPLTLFAVRIGMAIPILYFGTQLLAAPYFKAETAKGRIPGLSAAVLQKMDHHPKLSVTDTMARTARWPVGYRNLCRMESTGWSW